MREEVIIDGRQITAENVNQPIVGQTPLGRAVEDNNLGLVRQLLEMGARPGFDGYNYEGIVEYIAENRLIEGGFVRRLAAGRLNSQSMLGQG